MKNRESLKKENQEIPLEGQEEQEIRQHYWPNNFFENDVEAICRQAIEQAKKGNIQAIKIILDRILPTKKESSIIIDLPIVNTAQDILQAVNQVSAAICQGKISPTEGELLTRIIDRQAKAVELNEFEQRLKKLEERPNNENYH